MDSIVWDNGITVDECESIIKQYKDVESEVGDVMARPEDGDHLVAANDRNSSIYWIKETNLLVRSLFQFLLDANDTQFRYEVFNLSKSIAIDTVQFTKYSEGQYYNWHKDTFAVPQNGTNRKLSLTANLSDPKSYEGGNLEFFAGESPPTSPVKKRQGSVVCFESSDWHRITPVTKGVRYSLVLWIWGPQFR